MNPGGEVRFGPVKRLREAIGIGIEPAEKVFEFCAVVHMDGVAELMNEHVAEEILGKKEEWRVERYAAGCRSAAPDCALKADPDLRGAPNTNFIGDRIDRFGEEKFCFFTEPFPEQAGNNRLWRAVGVCAIDVKLSASAVFLREQCGPSSQHGNADIIDCIDPANTS